MDAVPCAGVRSGELAHIATEDVQAGHRLAGDLAVDAAGVAEAVTVSRARFAAVSLMIAASSCSARRCAITARMRFGVVTFGARGGRPSLLLEVSLKPA